MIDVIDDFVVIDNMIILIANNALHSIDFITKQYKMEIVLGG
jgi:hypothetical protein